MTEALVVQPSAGPRRGTFRIGQSFGAAAAYAGTVVAVAVSLPVLVHGLGARSYGAWVLTGGIVNLVASFDLGFSLTVTRFVARDFVGDRDAARRAIAVGAIGVVAIGIVAVIVALVAARPAARSLGIGEVAPAVVLAGVAFAVTLLGKVAQSALEGAGSVAHARWLQAAGAYFFCGALVALSATGSMSILSVTVVLLVQTVAVLIALSAALYRTFGCWPIARPRRAAANEVIRYAFAVQAASLASLAIEPASRIVVGAVIGPAAVAPLDIAARVRSQVFGAALAFTRPLIATLGAERSGRARASAAAVSTRAFAPIAACAAAFVAAIALRTFGTLFERGGGHVAAELSAAAVVLWLPTIIALPLYSYVLVAADARTILRIQIATSLVALALTGALVELVGVWAPVLGLGGGAIAGAVVTAASAWRLSADRACFRPGRATRREAILLAATCVACAVVLAPIAVVVALPVACMTWFAGGAPSLRQLRDVTA